MKDKPTPSQPLMDAFNIILNMRSSPRPEPEAMMKDKLMQLVEKWREEARQLDKQASNEYIIDDVAVILMDKASHIERCADQLEQAIKEATE